MVQKRACIDDLHQNCSNSIADAQELLKYNSNGLKDIAKRSTIPCEYMPILYS